jgi:hypothetical protein
MPTTPTTKKPVHVVAEQYTDGTQCAGTFCPGGPPPTKPVFQKGSKCKIDLIDPPTLTFVTVHVVYGTKRPRAGAVPVVDDASAVYPYRSSVPGFLKADVEKLVAGKRGFRAATWSIGRGVTSWVPFDCRRHVMTTTTSPTTGTRKTRGHEHGTDPAKLCPRDGTSARAAEAARPRRGRTAGRSSR